MGWTMHALNFHGPFSLTIKEIESKLGEGTSPGVIVLGRVDPAGHWHITTADRSDAHVRARLLSYVGLHSHFCFAFCDTAQAAFRLHCELFHSQSYDHAGHPCSPEGTSLTCHLCPAPAGRSGH